MSAEKETKKAMSASIALRTNSGITLNAAAELSSDGIILHSRSGTDRNRDYRQALELLMQRLDRSRISYEIYLDSRPVQHMPLAQRLLTFNRQAPISSRFDQLVHAMNAGSSS